jgi:DNA-binding PadR family transcriptional regulator
MTRSSADRRRRDLLLGEWACLGLLARGPSHGFELARMLAAAGEVGRVWTLTRPLVYRSLEQLAERDLVRSVGEEPGVAGGVRTIFDVTPQGRAGLDVWLATPVEHLRDLRSELLLKLVLGDLNDVDSRDLLRSQRAVVGERAVAAARLVERQPDDVVARWRRASASAASQFLDDLLAATSN